jgi:hypothetical protein
MKAAYICADQSVNSVFACDKAADRTFRFDLEDVISVDAAGAIGEHSVQQVSQGSGTSRIG